MASLLPEPADTCPDLRKEYEGKKIVLKNLEDGILGDLCGDEDDLKCTKVLITSDGPSAVLQGTRWVKSRNQCCKLFLFSVQAGLVLPVGLESA